MKIKHIKKPSILGKGYLGQQTPVQRFANTKYSKKSKLNQYHMEVKSLPSPAEFYPAIIDSFHEYNENWAWGCCPFHHDRSPSFTVNLVSGAFCCKSSNCGAKGGSLVSFVSQLHGLDLRESFNYLENWHE